MIRLGGPESEFRGVIAQIPTSCTTPDPWFRRRSGVFGYEHRGF